MRGEKHDKRLRQSDKEWLEDHARQGLGALRFILGVSHEMMKRNIPQSSVAADRRRCKRSLTVAGDRMQTRRRAGKRNPCENPDGG
jgi:hypothetical protein